MSAMHKDLSNRDYLSWLSFLRTSENWDESEIRDHQLSELKRIAKMAYNDTSGYRRSFESHGFHPDSIQSLDDVRRIPFLTKQNIRDDLESFSRQVPGRYHITTGGSTGVPTGMYRDPVSFAKELASKAHQYHRIGWQEGDRQIVFRGLKIDSTDSMDFVEEFNELRCSTYEFGTERMDVFRRAAFEFRPDWIRCYPSSGYVFASYLKQSGRTFPEIKGILCSSEQLFGFQNRLFREVFGPDIRIFSHYGHYEMAAVAGYCEKTDDYHVLPQYGFVELLDHKDNPVSTPGMVGEIVATSFVMEATPFVRYRTEDLAVFKSFGCEQCGRPYQVWERVEGRLQELIQTPSGKLISTSMLNMHDDTYEHIEQFQFHQKSRDSVIFRFVPKPTFSEQTKAQLYANLGSKLGDCIKLILDPVANIPLTHRGKHRLLIQELASPYDDASLAHALTI
jgi:phenylacetate-CoA ligase